MQKKPARRQSFSRLLLDDSDHNGLGFITPFFRPPRTLDIDRSDWDSIVTTRVNALLHGSPTALDAAMSKLRPHLRAPLHTRSGADEAPLAGPLTGTLVLEHVEAFSSAQQQALLRWSDATAGTVQVIATTNRPLFDLVKRRTFLEPLYYRLNIVHVDLEAID